MTRLSDLHESLSPHATPALTSAIFPPWLKLNPSKPSRDLTAKP